MLRHLARLCNWLLGKSVPPDPDDDIAPFLDDDDYGPKPGEVFKMSPGMSINAKRNYLVDVTQPERFIADPPRRIGPSPFKFKAEQGRLDQDE